MPPVGEDEIMIYPDDPFDYVEQGLVFNPAERGRDVSLFYTELMSGGTVLTDVLIFVGGFELRVATWFIGLCFLQAFNRPRFFLYEALLNYRFVVLRPIARPALIERAAAKVDFGLLAWRGLRLLRDWAAERFVCHPLAPLVGPDGNVESLRAPAPCSDCGNLTCLICARGHPFCEECRPEAYSAPVRRNRLPRGVPDLGYPVPIRQLVQTTTPAEFGVEAGRRVQKHCFRRCCPGQSRSHPTW